MYDGLNSCSSSSDAIISRDMNSLLYSSTFKHSSSDSEFAKIKQLISLDPYPADDNYDTHHETNEPKLDDNNDDDDDDDDGIIDHHGGERNSSLMRNRSTPSSFFSNLLLNQAAGGENNDQFLDPETDGRFFQKNESNEHDFLRYESLSPTPQMKQAHNISSNSYGYNNNSSSNNNNNNNNNNNMNSSNWDSTSSNMVSQTSSPSGFMSSLTNFKNGFAGMKEVRKGGSSNNHINFSLGPSSSSSRFLPQIDETENEFHDSTFSSHKRSRDGGLKMSQNGETANCPPNLVHHMSLPKTSSEMDAVDNFLHFQQDSSVPWKTRAKRGFATHPRSIAERLRRTRISERIKRLQELFPDMDKQTNTADMLDMAVEYIKDLQKELQTLNDCRARCTCSSKQLQSGSAM